MTYNDKINDNQGAVKASEIYTDLQLEIIKNQVGDTLLSCLQGIMKPIGDAIRYNNYIVHSTGTVRWVFDTPNYVLDFSPADPANIIVTLLMMDENSISRSVDLILQGGVSSSQYYFNNISLAQNELLYLEISRENLLNALSGQLIIENGVDFPVTATEGKRLKKIVVNSNSSMPAITAALNTNNSDTYGSNTVNIPLCIRYDWTQNTQTYQDLWWIPHGIRWPLGVQSMVGGVVVEGINVLPNYFVSTQSQFINALQNLQSSGGIIVPTETITITAPITIPANITIMGRTSSLTGTGFGRGSFVFQDGAYFLLQNSSCIKNLPILTQSGYGSGGPIEIIRLNGINSSVLNCEFSLVSGTTYSNVKCIYVNASNCKIDQNYFTSMSSGATGIYFAVTSNCSVSLNRFVNVKEFAYFSRENSLSVKSDYGLVPIGSVIPWLGASYINSTNGTPLKIVSEANLENYLDDSWVICNGSLLPVDSPLNSGSNTRVPNLTDQRFLRGDATYGDVGGSNLTALAVSNLPSHNHGLNAHTHTFDHQHSINHGHGAYTNSGGEHWHEILARRQNANGNHQATSTLAAGEYDQSSYTYSINQGGHYHSIVVNNYTGTTAPSGSYITQGPSTANTTLTGSGASFSNEPNYINVIYIMRVK